ncbi:unnamed protein product, partial [Clonostachys rosea]
MAAPKVLIMMADYGHEPTANEEESGQRAEATVPYTAFKSAGFDVQFATENGKAPACDKLLLEGLSQKILHHLADLEGMQGAKGSVLQDYAKMVASEECKQTLSWTAPGFSLDPFSLV